MGSPAETGENPYTIKWTTGRTVSITGLGGEYEYFLSLSTGNLRYRVIRFETEPITPDNASFYAKAVDKAEEMLRAAL